MPRVATGVDLSQHDGANVLCEHLVEDDRVPVYSWTGIDTFDPCSSAGSISKSSLPLIMWLDARPLAIPSLRYSRRGSYVDTRADVGELLNQQTRA